MTTPKLDHNANGIADMKTFRERTAGDVIGRVDEIEGIIFDALLVGHKSKNNRRYENSAFERALHKYDGVQVFDGHESDRDGTSSLIGYARNPKLKSDGIHGDIYLVKSHPLFARTIEHAKRFPKGIGFSHECAGQSTVDFNGQEIVESIDEVSCIALVCTPGTTKGIFESTGSEQRATKLSAIVDNAIQVATDLQSRIGRDKNYIFVTAAAESALEDLRATRQAIDDAGETVNELASSVALAASISEIAKCFPGDERLQEALEELQVTAGLHPSKGEIEARAAAAVHTDNERAEGDVRGDGTETVAMESIDPGFAAKYRERFASKRSTPKPPRTYASQFTEAAQRAKKHLKD